MPAFPDPDTRNVLAPDCRRCPALVESRACISWGNGPRDAAVAVVGEAPGAGDPDADRWQGGNHTGLAYTSRHSGRVVRTLCSDVGFDVLEDCHFTNAVKCFPSDGDGGNREPTPTERANCRPYLRTELDAVDPTAVLATGKHATASLLAVEGRSLEGFLDAVLDPIPCPTLGTTVVPLVHPSYQAVWISRLGYDYDGYVAAVREALEAVGVEFDGPT
jgi:DNA polymerase